MTRELPPEYQCGDLRICPSLGTITNAAGGSARFGPVNMKVLEALLARAGEVVSRSELFETVWKNQVVGEDALTRCISDIRAELKALSGRDDWIETLPKRGYRWLGDERQIEAAEPDDAAPQPNLPTANTASPQLMQRLARLTLQGTYWLGAFAVLAVMLVWATNRTTDDNRVVIAMLPATASAELAGQAAAFDLALTEYLMQIDGVRLLSPSAIESRPANPFPFFFYEFGARWLIETDLREINGSTTIVLTVADARTGITETQISDQLARKSVTFDALLKFMTPE